MRDVSADTAVAIDDDDDDDDADDAIYDTRRSFGLGIGADEA
jgi:hypothetical protein